jgi:hypothetical protein
MAALANQIRPSAAGSSVGTSQAAQAGRTAQAGPAREIGGSVWAPKLRHSADAAALPAVASDCSPLPGVGGESPGIHSGERS